ncbi:hypothetical protein D049_1710B, partial [Vibrio parahaemolyticus VPTS-2010]
DWYQHGDKHPHRLLHARNQLLNFTK